MRWIASALGLLVASWLLDGITVDGPGWALIAAAFLGIFNALVRPVLILLTLPITILTMGLFILVINGLMLWLTGSLLAGFHVAGFWSGFAGAIIVGVVSLLANTIVNDRGGFGRMQGEIIEMRLGKGGRWEP